MLARERVKESGAGCDSGMCSADAVGVSVDVEMNLDEDW